MKSSANSLFLFIQFITHHLPIINDQYQNSRIEIVIKDDKSFDDVLAKQLEVWKAQVMESSVSHNNDGTTAYTMVVKMSTNIKGEEIFSFFKKKGLLLFSVSEILYIDFRAR